MAINTIDNWEYARWVTVIGRSLRFNPAVALSAELTAAEAFFAYERTKRPWLEDDFIGNSEEIQGLVTTDNPQVLGKQIEIIGRDMNKITVQDDAEKTQVDTLIAATGERRYGDESNTVASNVHQP
jgi:hypothetical protein